MVNAVSQRMVKMILLITRPSTWLNAIHALESQLKGGGRCIGKGMVCTVGKVRMIGRHQRPCLPDRQARLLLKNCVDERRQWRSLRKNQPQSKKRNQKD